MDALRAIVSAHKLSLILITHTRKSRDADPLNLVSGSTGLVGTVDGVFVLEKTKRGGGRARLTIANRDTEGYQFELRFDREACHGIVCQFTRSKSSRTIELSRAEAAEDRENLETPRCLPSA